MIDPSKIDKEKTLAHLGDLLRELEAEKLQPTFTAYPPRTGPICSAPAMQNLPKTK